MPFKSKQQAKWAFATKQPFAKRWEDMTDASVKGGIKGLPKRVKGAAKRKTAKKK